MQTLAPEIPHDRFTARAMGLKKYHGPPCPIDGTTLRNVEHDECIACFCQRLRTLREQAPRKAPTLTKDESRRIAKQAQVSRQKARALKEQRKAAERLAKHEMRVATVSAHDEARADVEAGRTPSPPAVIQRAQPGAQTHEGEPCPIDGTTQKYSRLGGSCVHCNVMSSWAGMVREWNARGDTYAKPH